MPFDAIKRYGAFPALQCVYKHRAGAYAILRRGDWVLVTHQSYPCAEYQLPGGGLDADESPLQALHREVIEETGWRIGLPRRLGAHRHFTYMPDYDLWAEKVCHIYVARPIVRVAACTQAGHRAVWMPIGQAAKTLATVGDRVFVAGLC